ncbi:MAG: winged helix-turn-helix domain-containing protein, partial [Acidobacteriota bacterium]
MDRDQTGARMQWKEAGMSAASAPGRATEPDGAELRFGEFAYEGRRGVLLRYGEEVDLPPRAVGVLDVLLGRAGELVTREELEAELWEEPPATPRSLNEAVMQLRRALGDDPREPDYVQTVHRRGYRFIAPVRAVDGSTAASGTGTPPRRAGLAGVALVAGIVGLIAGAILTPLAGTAVEPGPEPGPDLQVQLALDAPLVPEASGESALAISPDGTRLAYVARSPAGGRQLRLLELGGHRSRLLGGTEGRPRSPFFSPDGRWVGYFGDGFLWRVAVSGGEPLALCAVPDGPRVAGTWTHDNRIVFSGGSGRGLWSVPAYGGDSVVLSSPGGGGRSHLSPHALPDTSVVLYAV